MAEAWAGADQAELDDWKKTAVNLRGTVATDEGTAQAAQVALSQGKKDAAAALVDKVDKLSGEKKAIEAREPTYTEQDSQFLNSIPKHEIGKEFLIKAVVLNAIAAAGAIYMHTGAVGAMNGMASAMQGLHDGDMAKYKAGLETYDRHRKAIVDGFTKRHSIWNNEIKRKDADIAEIERSYRLHMAALGDTVPEMKSLQQHQADLNRSEKMIKQLESRKDSWAKFRAPDHRETAKKIYDEIAAEHRSDTAWKEDPANTFEAMFKAGKLKQPGKEKKDPLAALMTGATPSGNFTIVKVK